jgi:ABC-type glycerol-3-phosphate transport system substrate-binding protein
MKIKSLRSKLAISSSLVLVAGLVATGLPSAHADTSTLKPTAAQLAAWKGKTITYYFYHDSQAELDTTNAMITDFQNLTGATVKLDDVPYTTLDQQLQARIAAGNTPDVARLNNPGLYQNVALDLETYFGRTYKSEFLKGSTLQVQDPKTTHLIGLPYDLSVNGPIINVDLFKKAGIAIPTSWNWATLIANAKKAQAAGGTDYAFAMDKSGHRFSTVMSQFGAFMVDKNQKNVLPTSQHRAAKALKLITDLYAADLAPRDLWVGTGTKYSSPVNVFIAGAVPVFFSGNFNLATINANAKFNFAVVPNPKELNGGGWPGGKFLMAFKASKNADLAAYFTNWLAQPAQMERMDKAAFWLPTRNDLVAKGITYSSRQTDMNNYLADAAATPSAAYGIQSVPTLTGSIYNNLRDLMTLVMTKKITADQAIATQISFIDTQLATLKK